MFVKKDAFLVSADQPSPGSKVSEELSSVSIIRKERHFQGMLEYRKEDENKLLKTLITGNLLYTRTKCVLVLFSSAIHLCEFMDKKKTVIIYCSGQFPAFYPLE